MGPSQIQDRSRIRLALPDLGLDDWLESRRGRVSGPWTPGTHRPPTPGRLCVPAAFAVRLAAVRSRAASLPGPDQITALETAALAKPRQAMTPAEIRALAAEAIAHLREVTGKLTELSALLGGDEADEGTS